MSDSIEMNAVAMSTSDDICSLLNWETIFTLAIKICDERIQRFETDLVLEKTYRANQLKGLNYSSVDIDEKKRIDMLIRNLDENVLAIKDRIKVYTGINVILLIALHAEKQRESVERLTLFPENSTRFWDELNSIRLAKIGFPYHVSLPESYVLFRSYIDAIFHEEVHDFNDTMSKTTLSVILCDKVRKCHRYNADCIELGKACFMDSKHLFGL